MLVRIADTLIDLRSEDCPASLRPFALDMSSGVETDGFKDLEKIRAAVAAVRRFS